MHSLHSQERDLNTGVTRERSGRNKRAPKGEPHEVPVPRVLDVFLCFLFGVQLLLSFLCQVHLLCNNHVVCLTLFFGTFIVVSNSIQPAIDFLPLFQFRAGLGWSPSQLSEGGTRFKLYSTVYAKDEIRECVFLPTREVGTTAVSLVAS